MYYILLVVLGSIAFVSGLLFYLNARKRFLLVMEKDFAAHLHLYRKGPRQVYILSRKQERELMEMNPAARTAKLRRLLGEAGFNLVAPYYSEKRPWDGLTAYYQDQEPRTGEYRWVTINGVLAVAERDACLVQNGFDLDRAVHTKSGGEERITYYQAHYPRKK